MASDTFDSLDFFDSYKKLRPLNDSSVISIILANESMKENNKSQTRRHEVEAAPITKDPQGNSEELLREKKEELRLLIER